MTSIGTLQTGQFSQGQASSSIVEKGMKSRSGSQDTSSSSPLGTGPSTADPGWFVFTHTLSCGLAIVLFFSSLLWFVALHSEFQCGPDGLISENRHQAFSQSCFCFLLEVSIRDRFLCVLRALICWTSKQASTQFHVIFMLYFCFNLLILGINIIATKSFDRDMSLLMPKQHGFSKVFFCKSINNPFSFSVTTVHDGILISISFPFFNILVFMLNMYST